MIPMEVSETLDLLRALFDAATPGEGAYRVHARGAFNPCVRTGQGQPGAASVSSGSGSAGEVATTRSLPYQRRFTFLMRV